MNKNGSETGFIPSDNPALRTIRFAVLFIVNVFVATFAAAILDKIEFPPAWHHISWLFFRGFGFTFLVAAGVGFFLQRYWSTGVGKWVWIGTTAIFALGASIYIARVQNSRPLLIALWQHFSGRDCLTNVNASDCQDLFIFTTTLVRGAAYSMGAALAERFPRIAHRTNAFSSTPDVES